MKTSAAGIDLIQRNEGCDLVARLDTLADPPVWTIGHGETGPYVVQGMRYTRAQAKEGLLRRLAQEFEPAVLEAIGDAPTTQGQWDAMVSLAWNIGAGAFKGSTLAKYHRARQHGSAAEEFLKWNKAGGRVIDGLVGRREEERSLYLSGATEPENIPENIPDPDSGLDRDLIADLVRSVQRVVGTTPDGILGPLTYAAVQAAQQRART